MDEDEAYLGAAPVKIQEINASNGATVNITIIVKRDDKEILKKIIDIIKVGGIGSVAAFLSDSL